MPDAIKNSGLVVGNLGKWIDKFCMSVVLIYELFLRSCPDGHDLRALHAHPCEQLPRTVPEDKCSFSYLF